MQLFGSFVDWCTSLYVTLLQNLQRDTHRHTQNSHKKLTPNCRVLNPDSYREADSPHNNKTLTPNCRVLNPDSYREADSPHNNKTLTPNCRVLKLADKPSGLGGGEFGIKSSLWRPNRSLEVRVLPLQQKSGNDQASPKGTNLLKTNIVGC
jgi:hypothetical protein